MVWGRQKSMCTDREAEKNKTKKLDLNIIATCQCLLVLVYKTYVFAELRRNLNMLNPPLRCLKNGRALAMCLNMPLRDLHKRIDF